MTNYNPILLSENQTSKTYPIYFKIFSIQTCSTCYTYHYPNHVFCTYCGDLLNIRKRYNIDLGEYYI